MNLTELRANFAKYKIKSTGTEGALGALSDTQLKDILGLPADATSNDVKLAHRKAILVTHPDKRGLETDFQTLTALKEELDGRFDGTRRQRSAAASIPTPFTPTAHASQPHFSAAPSYFTAPSASRAHPANSFAQHDIFTDPLADILDDLCRIFAFGFKQKTPTTSSTLYPSHFSKHEPKPYHDSGLGHGIRFVAPKTAPQKTEPDPFAKFLSQAFGPGTDQPGFSKPIQVRFIGSDLFVSLFCSKGHGLSDLYSSIPSYDRIPQAVASAGRGGRW